MSIFLPMDKSTVETYGIAGEVASPAFRPRSHTSVGYGSTVHGRGSMIRRGLLKLTGTGLTLFGLASMFYFLGLRTFIPNSDSATVILEGQSMAAGHLALHGWALSLDSFWTLDAAIGTLFVVFGGVRPIFLHILPAFVAALVVVLGTRLAYDRFKHGAAIAAGVTSFLLLTFPSIYLCHFLLSPAVHVVTTLWCLAAFFALSRRPGLFCATWWVGVLFLAAGLLGDLQMVPLGVAPVLVSGITVMMRTRSVRAGAPLVLASVGSVAVAAVVRGVAELVGTYSIGKVQPSATIPQVVHNLPNLVKGAVEMFGVGRYNAGTPSIADLAHAVGLVIVIASVIYFLVIVVYRSLAGRDAAGPEASSRRVKMDWQLDHLLFFAVVGGSISYLKLALSNSISFDRYLTSAVIFSCVLAGRSVGRLFSRFGSARLLIAVALLGIASVVGLGFGTRSILDQPTLTPAAVKLASFLQARDLNQGIGDYWSASITTVMSADRVIIRPVIGNPGGEIVRYGRQSNAAWYQGKSFQFLVYSTTKPGGVDLEMARSTFGEPSGTFTVDSFVVLTWNHPLVISPSAVYDPG